MSNKLITVAILEQLSQADMMKDWLDSAGIESYIPDHGISIEDATQLGKRIELQVSEKDALKALEIIGSLNVGVRKEPNSSAITIPLIKKILVPVDFSSYSLNAAHYAAHVAHQKGAQITLIHVYFNPVTNPVSYDHFYSFPANVAETLSEIVENAENLMRDFKVKMNAYITAQDFSGIKMRTEILGGIAEEAILDFAEAGHYDLIILGIRGKGATENWFGSFMTEIINKSSITVLAIPEHATYKNTMFKRLMYATNFDKSDGAAILELIKIAAPLETHISVVHIDETTENPFINYDLAHFKEKYVGDVDQVQMDFDLIISKSKARGIENYIIDHQIDIIAVTAHKRNILTALFKPSLTKELLLHLEIPMLVFHSN